VQQARHTAQNILRALAGRPLVPFRYRQQGLAGDDRRSPPSPTSASSSFRRARLAGWLLLHLMFVVGFRNRLSVLFVERSFISIRSRGAGSFTGPLRGPTHARAERPVEPGVSPPENAGDIRGDAGTS